MGQTGISRKVRRRGASRTTAFIRVGMALCPIMLNPRIGGEAAVDGNDRPRDERRRAEDEPDEDAGEIGWRPETAQRGMGDDGLSPGGQAACLLVREQEAVLFRQEETRRDGVDPDPEA